VNARKLGPLLKIVTITKAQRRVLCFTWVLPIAGQTSVLVVAVTDQDGLERAQPEIVVALRRQLLLAQLEQRHDLLGQLLRGSETRGSFQNKCSEKL
jgi:hypothetical protein